MQPPHYSYCFKLFGVDIKPFISEVIPFYLGKFCNNEMLNHWKKKRHVYIYVGVE